MLCRLENAAGISRLYKVRQYSRSLPTTAEALQFWLGGFSSNFHYPPRTDRLNGQLQEYGSV